MMLGRSSAPLGTSTRRLVARLLPLAALAGTVGAYGDNYANTGAAATTTRGDPMLTQVPEEPLAGGMGNRGEVLRVGDTVRRPVSDHSSTVSSLLEHLAVGAFRRRSRPVVMKTAGRSFAGSRGTFPSRLSGVVADGRCSGERREAPPPLPRGS